MSSEKNHSSIFNSLFESLEERVLFDGVPDANFVLPQIDAAEPIPAQVQSAHQADVSGPRELIIIDPGVSNSEELLAEVLESRGDTAFEVLTLHANEDGVSQITEILGQAEGEYDAIHILSHGDEGEVQLGNTVLSAENLGRYTDELAGWADALTEDADLLFYGCELAGNENGESFICLLYTSDAADE